MMTIKQIGLILICIMPFILIFTGEDNNNLDRAILSAQLDLNYDSHHSPDVSSFFPIANSWLMTVILGQMIMLIFGVYIRRNYSKTYGIVEISLITIALSLFFHNTIVSNVYALQFTYNNSSLFLSAIAGANSNWFWLSQIVELYGLGIGIILYLQKKHEVINSNTGSTF